MATLEESPSSVPHFSVINSRQLAMFYLTLNRGAPLPASPAAHLVTCTRKRIKSTWLLLSTLLTYPHSFLSLSCFWLKEHSSETGQPFLDNPFFLFIRCSPSDRWRSLKAQQLKLQADFKTVLILFCDPLLSTSSVTHELFSSAQISFFLSFFLCVKLFNLVCPGVCVAATCATF